MAADLRIEPLAPEQLDEAVAVLARAFEDNPMHVAAFGQGRLDLSEALFRIVLGASKGRRIVALEDGRILGVAHWTAWPSCQLSVLDRLRMSPALLRAFGPVLALRVARWLAARDKHDPQEPHMHLGPIAVAPEAQGKGVGRRLMEAYCAELDQGRQAGCLETDNQTNVEIYRGFGFDIREEVEVLGVRSYQMWREGRQQAPR